MTQSIIIIRYIWYRLYSLYAYFLVRICNIIYLYKRKHQFSIHDRFFFLFHRFFAPDFIYCDAGNNKKTKIKPQFLRLTIIIQLFNRPPLDKIKTATIYYYICVIHIWLFLLSGIISFRAGKLFIIKRVIIIAACG